MIKRLHDLNIAVKLLLAFLLMLLLMAGMGLFALNQLARVNATTDELVSKWIPVTQISLTQEKVLARVRSTEFQHILGNAETMASLEKSLDARYAEFTDLQQQYQRLPLSAQERSAYEQIRQTLAAYLVEHRKIIALSRENRKDEALALTKGASLKAYRDIEGQFAALRKLGTEGTAAASERADVIYQTSQHWLILLLVLALVVGVALALSIARVVARPLREALALARRVASRDLSNSAHTAQLRHQDETGQLMQALDDMTSSLNQIVAELGNSVAIINVASGEIASGNADLSARTEAQASSLEQTSSAMEELTSTVQQNADHARHANTLMATTSNIASQGGSIVSQVVDKMATISDSSRRIADITGVIDAIAFQTNILALNAAVEAARAGEQGRGFAVVATEVRSLAQRSAGAAREIRQLIGDSVGQVEEGSQLVAQAGSTMTQIVTSVQQVAALIQEISVASIEQSSGIGEVSRAVLLMDESTQQNAALVEQAAAAAQSLRDQMSSLSQTIGQFRLASSVM